jgi:PAS domain S-box-containing protein
LESEAKYSWMFENTLKGFAFCRVFLDENDKSVDFVYVEVNPAFEKLTGLKKDYVIGIKVIEAIPKLKELNLELFEIYQKITLTGKKEQIEMYVEPLKLWLLIDIYSPYKDYFLIAFENITDQKKADQEKQRILESLLQENKKLYSIINSINKEVWFTDTEKNVTLVNPEAQKEFGLDSPMLLDIEKYTESLDVFRCEGGRRPANEAPSLRALKGEIVSDQEEVIRNPQSGELRYRQVSAAPVKDTMGNMLGAVSIVQDITEFRKTQNALRESNRRIVLMNEKLRVVGGLTRHDARNKLSIMDGNLHLARKGLPSDSKTLIYLSRIESNIDQISEIFNFTVLYEQIGLEKLVYLDLEKTIEAASSILSEFPAIEISTNCHGLNVLADSLLNQLFLNLIDNSLKHGKTISKLRTYYLIDKNGNLKIIYEDNGVGIPYVEKQKIFTEGFSTDEGTGYGLYLIKKLTEVYGWTIEETGEPGKGAQFTINIPIKNQDNKENFQLQNEQ